MRIRQNKSKQNKTNNVKKDKMKQNNSLQNIIIFMEQITKKRCKQTKTKKQNKTR